MKKWSAKIIVAVVAVIVVATGVYGVLFWGPYRMVQNQRLSGTLVGNREFSGTVTVTGDTTVVGNARFLPGTKVQFVVGDDQGGGDEVPPDGFLDNDPARLFSYSQTHARFVVLGRLEARGLQDNPILFTSASPTPHLADWEAFYFYGDGSTIDHAVFEYSRNGMNPLGSQPHSVARNSVFRHNLWSGPSLSSSSMTLEHSDISDAGHEGVDVQGGAAVIRDNFIHDTHSGIVVVAGTATIENNRMVNTSAGISAGPGVTLEREQNNTVELAPATSTLEWRYGDWVYRMYGDH